LPVRRERCEPRMRGNGAGRLGRRVSPVRNSGICSAVWERRLAAPRSQ